MKRLLLTKDYRKDLKRELRGRYGVQLESLMQPLLTMLQNGETLPDKYRDHALIGDYKGTRECHIKPDLLLIYAQPDTDSIILVRLGSHAALFG